MSKTILIIALCAPLGGVAWYETQKLYETSRPPALTKEKASSPDELAQIREKADSVLKKLPDSMAKTALLLDDPPEVHVDAGPLAEAVQAQGGTLKNYREKIETARVEEAKRARKIKNLADSFRGEDRRLHFRAEKLGELDDELKSYARLDLFDPEFLASFQAEADWAKNIEKPKADLLELYENLDRWTPTSSAAVKLLESGVIKRHIIAYQTFIDAHGRAKGDSALGLVREAREELALWENGARTVDLLRLRSDRRLDQIRGIVTVAANDALPRFLVTGRRLVRVLSDDLLKHEPPDKMVLLFGGDQVRPEPKLRTDVWVLFTDAVKFKKLQDSGFNEDTLLPDRVSSLRVGAILYSSPTYNLKGTSYNNAINAYNKELSEVDHWTEDALTQLRATCEAKKSELNDTVDDSAGGPTLIKRIDELLVILRTHPKLFGAAP